MSAKREIIIRLWQPESGGWHAEARSSFDGPYTVRLGHGGGATPQNAARRAIADFLYMEKYAKMRLGLAS
jgi:hypothetical protein